MIRSHSQQNQVVNSPKSHESFATSPNQDQSSYLKSMILDQFLVQLSQEEKQNKKLIRLIQDEVNYFFTYHKTIDAAGLRSLKDAIQQLKINQLQSGNDTKPQATSEIQNDFNQKFQSSSKVNGGDKPLTKRESTKHKTEETLNQPISILNLSDIAKLNSEGPSEKIDQIINTEKVITLNKTETPDLNFQINTKEIQNNSVLLQNQPFLISPQGNFINKKRDDLMWKQKAVQEYEDYQNEIAMQKKQKEEETLRLQHDLYEQIHFKKEQKQLQSQNDKNFFEAKQKDALTYFEEQEQKSQQHQNIIQETSDYQRRQMEEKETRKFQEKIKEQELKDLLESQVVQSKLINEQIKREKIQKEKQMYDSMKIDIIEKKQLEEINQKVYDQKLIQVNDRYNKQMSDQNQNEKSKRQAHLNNQSIDLIEQPQFNVFKQKQSEDHEIYLKSMQENLKLEQDLKQKKKQDIIENQLILIQSLDQQLEEKRKLKELVQKENQRFFEQLTQDVQISKQQEKAQQMRKREQKNNYCRDIDKQLLLKQMN